VRIANCFVQSSDDTIVPKSSPSLGYLRTTEHLTVTNCVLTTTCNAIVHHRHSWISSPRHNIEKFSRHNPWRRPC